MNAYPSATPPPTPQQQNSGLAIASLIMGILALLMCVFGPALGIPAIICGHLARGKVRKSGGLLKGEGMALAGLICGYLNLAMLVLVLPIAIPNFIKARTIAQKNGCVANLKVLEGAKSGWVSQKGLKEGDPVKMEDLVGSDSYLKKEPACPAKGQYTLGAVGEVPTCSISGHELPAE